MAVPFTLLTRTCFLDLWWLAVYLQHDPAALSQGSPGASPQPSGKEEADPAAGVAAVGHTGAQGPALKVTDRYVALCARYSAGQPCRKGKLMSSCLSASVYRLTGL